MGRKNHRSGHGQARRKADGTKGQTTPPPPPIEEMIVPRGRCFLQSRKGLLRFSEAEAARALLQAQQSRARRHSGYVEDHAFPCPAGGCGDWHLSARTQYIERTYS